MVVRPRREDSTKLESSRRRSHHNRAIARVREKRPSPIAEAIKRVIARVGDVVDAMVAAYQEQIPLYAKLAGSDLEAVRAASRLHALTILTRMAKGQPLTREELERLGELGRARFQQGFGLESLTEAYHIGAAVVADYLCQELQEICTAPSRLESLREQVRERVHRYSREAADAVTRSYLCARRDARATRGVRGQLLAGLLPGAGEGIPTTDTEAADSDIRWDTPHVVAVIDLDPPVEDREAREKWLTRIGEAIALKEPVPIDAGIWDSRFVLLAPLQEGMWNDTVASTAREALRSVHPLSSRAVVGIGGAAVGGEGIRESYREALQAVELLRTMSNRNVMTIEETVPYLFIRKSLPEARKLFERLIRPLVAYDRKRGQLLAVLGAYIELRGSVNGIAKLFHVHRSTVHYRLRLIQKLTGRRVQDPESLWLFKLGLGVHEILPAEIRA